MAIDMRSLNRLQKKVLQLKERENAVMLVHNYQVSEIQEIADFIGDSLQLSIKAAEVENMNYIVFCGVDFMAETASILNPNKRVILPAIEARCPMAAMLTAEKVIEARGQHPDALVVLYVNTLAEAKAEADVMCTSANAAQVVGKLNADKILFGPDKNLAWYVQSKIPDKEIIPIPPHGHCYVHTMFGAETIIKKEQYPKAELMVHPECDPEIQKAADFVGSTGQMYRHAQESHCKEFIVATETGLIERMRREIPHKTFVCANEEAKCKQMKSITLEKVFLSLKNKSPIVKVPERIAVKARKAMERMMEL